MLYETIYAQLLVYNSVIHCNRLYSISCFRSLYLQNSITQQRICGLDFPPETISSPLSTKQMRSDLVSPARAGLLLGPRLSRFFSCVGLFESASGRGNLQAKLFWPPLIFLRLLFRSGTCLSFKDYWFWVIHLALSTGPGLFCRTGERGYSFVMLGPLVSGRTWCPSGLRPWPGSLHPVWRRPRRGPSSRDRTLALCW